MPITKRAERAARPEYQLGAQRYSQLTGQLRDAYSKLDGTLAHVMRMTAEMIDTCDQMGVEPERGQKLIAGLSKFSEGMINSRHDLIAAHLEATRIRMRTDQAARADGCFPWPFGEEDEKLRIVA